MSVENRNAVLNARQKLEVEFQTFGSKTRGQKKDEKKFTRQTKIKNLIKFTRRFYVLYGFEQFSPTEYQR